MIAQSVFFVGIFYFIGYFSESGYYDYFGMPVRFIGESPTNVIFQGGRVVVLLGLLTLLIGSLAVPVYRVLERVHARRSRDSYLALTGASCLFFVVGLLRPDSGSLAGELLYAIQQCGLLLCVMALLLLVGSGGSSALSFQGRRGRYAAMFFCGIATISIVSHACGFYSAYSSVRNGHAIPAVVLLAKDGFGFDEKQVCANVATPAGEEYKHCYNGLRLITRKNGRLYLVKSANPQGGLWIVPDNDSVLLRVVTN